MKARRHAKEDVAAMAPKRIMGSVSCRDAPRKGRRGYGVKLGIVSVDSVSGSDPDHIRRGRVDCGDDNLLYFTTMFV